MSIIEYAENICGRELTEHEKTMVRFFGRVPKGAILVPCRGGQLRLMDRNGNFIKLSKEDFAE